MMNEAVERALAKSQEKLRAQQQHQRAELALYFNLYTRDYAPDGQYSEQYGFFDGKESPRRYFRKIVNPLTDEEVEALTAMRAKLEASAPPKDGTGASLSENDDQGSKTTTGTAYYGVGICILLLSAIAGLIVGGSGSLIGYAAPLFGWGVFISGAFSSMSFFAIGKGLLLLQDIANNTRRKN